MHKNYEMNWIDKDGNEDNREINLYKKIKWLIGITMMKWK